MSINGYLKGIVHRRRCERARQSLLGTGSSPEIHRDDWARSLIEPTEFYTDCFRYFHDQLPAGLKEHRNYFAKEGRGFGEEAFHTMWFLIFREFKPQNFLEIGVYRGQVLSLIALLQKTLARAGRTVGISPFIAAGDSVSKYRRDIDYEEDTKKNFAHFNLAAPELLKAYSTDEAALKLINSITWDCIYIDGNHDYEVASSDWHHCARNLRQGGLIVLDDAGLTTRYVSPVFATRGHPGPSRVAQEIDAGTFTEILQVGHNRVFQKQR